MNRPAPLFRTYRSYIRERFGRPVLKVPLHAGFSCPNRDGTLSAGGCTFCDNEAFSPALKARGTPVEQLERAMARTSGQFDAYIAYFQPFSNTYGTVRKLREAFEPLIGHPGLVGIAVGTRPDCFSDEKYAYLGDVAVRTYLSVELGLQSADDEILRRCNRGHTFAQFESACLRLHTAGIETAAHILLGLPGETDETVVRTAQAVAALPVHGVKLHQLMIIAGTPMERSLREGAVEALSLERYAELVAMFLSYLRPDQCIHRLVADTRPERGLVAPQWSVRKAAAVSYIRSYLIDKGVRQGARNKLNV
jgi:radical SAM protein (TIGR01212 family)